MLTPDTQLQITALRTSIAGVRTVLTEQLECLARTIRADPGVTLGDLVRALGPEADRLAAMALLLALDLVCTGEPAIDDAAKGDRLADWLTHHMGSAIEARRDHEHAALEALWQR